MKKFQLIILIFYVFVSFGQEKGFKSIHQEESDYYNSLGSLSTREYDSIQNFNHKEITDDHGLKAGGCHLEYTVFGYHPYWMGSAYLNYKWNLLSDLCYFSYEVDPNTGDPVTVHEWLTSPVIDSAQANNVKVHLCVTLFSGHSDFFADTNAQNNLIQNLIWYVEQRNADGINMDFEAVSFSLADVYMEFLVKVCERFHEALPGSVVSIAMPAVDWNGMFDISLLKNYFDLFMIMGYDYYWNGSSQAGPIAPLYSFTSGYNYSLSRTISYYEATGMQKEKIVLGLPYYGRRWPTESNTIPGNATGAGVAYKYSTIKNDGSGNYSPENHYWDPVSFSGCYIFNNNGWYQCFLEEVHGLGKRYDIVRFREYAGIGIWALGYDNGYTELWNLINEKLTNCWFQPVDTVYDSGGPEWDYYNNESYTMTISTGGFLNIGLNFYSFHLEPEYDSLWIYDGPDTLYPLIGGYSGSNIPAYIESTEPVLTLKFKSDIGVTHTGWEAVFYELPYSVEQQTSPDCRLELFPNPASSAFEVRSLEFTGETGCLDIYGISGHPVDKIEIAGRSPSVIVNVEHWNHGLYLIRYTNNNGQGQSKKILIQ